MRVGLRATLLLSTPHSRLHFRQSDMQRHRARILLQHPLNGFQMDPHQPGSCHNIPRAKRRQELATLFGKPWRRSATRRNLCIDKAHVNLGDRIHNHGHHLVSGSQGQQLVKLA